MDEQTDDQIPAQTAVQQKQQPSNFPQKTASNDPTPQQQEMQQPEGKKSGWLKWLIIVLGVLIIAGGIYFFFFR